MIVYAINISSGGGKILLDELILNHPFGKPSILFLDQRYALPIGVFEKDFTIYRVKPKLTHRMTSEWTLRRVSKANSDYPVLCFGNMPPAFRLKSKTIVYLQNAFLLENVPSPKDSLKLVLRNTYEKIWFKCFIRNADEIWVQTKWMMQNLSANLQRRTSVKPFLPTLPKIELQNEKTIDFISVTGSLKYKNLVPLLTAIESSHLLDKKFVIVSDHKNDEIDSLLKSIKEKGISLEYYTNISRDKLYTLMGQAKCMLITSSLESFCLPLHEALHFKLDLITGNLAFVTEYTTPTETFKDLSVSGIRDGILRYASKP